jgi:predicted DNA-binding transcriptional regulator AlpA
MTTAITPADEAPNTLALLVSAQTAAQLCGRSEASWWRDHAAARIPAPIKLGGRTLWRSQDLQAWIEAGCPNRRDWEILRARKGGAK